MIEIIKFPHHNTNLAEQAKAIRFNVFVKEQNVDPLLEYDGHDSEATHYLLYYKNIAVGTARWRKTANGIKMERFALLSEYRNKGIGSKLLERVMEDVLFTGKSVYLHAQEKAVNYYLRVGFVVEGDAFYEAGIKHYKMIYINKS